MSLSQGQVLQNRYRVVKLLGQGGFGAVYRAYDLTLKIACALKENLDVSDEAQCQFEREALILAGLRHPALPRVTDYFFLPGQGQYLIMDFIEGEDLQAMLVRVGSPLPETQVLAWMGQICDALAYLHSQNPPIIHRDIKPANVKVTPQGMAVLVDFGIAKVYDPHLKTTIGARAVTPGFSPIEQYGQGTTDARTDVYALGATIYMVLTGSEPPESIVRVTGTPMQSPRAFNPAVSFAVEQAILRAMEVMPTGRLQSIFEFKTALMTTSASQSAFPIPAIPTSQAPIIPKSIFMPQQIATSSVSPQSFKSASFHERTCPRCKTTIIKQNAFYCPACGERLGGNSSVRQNMPSQIAQPPVKLHNARQVIAPKSVLCAHCGGQVPKGTHFYCPTCGERLADNRGQK